MTTKITEKNISNLANAGVEWQSVITADGSTGTTGVAGRGYFIDTTSAAHTFTLPASATRGDTIVIKDYAGTFATNNVTLGLNGHKIDGQSFATAFSTNHSIIQLIYSDVTKGWRSMQNVSVTDIGLAPVYISATGGTVTTSGNFKIHTFTGDGSFIVSTAGNVAGSNTVSYLVVAGGGGAYSGGGGAGGFREGKATSDCYSASPLSNPGGLPVSATTYPITVGGGGSPGSGHPGSGIPVPPTSFVGGTSGSPSVFSTITSTGGGRGGSQSAPDGLSGQNGGSGGGGGTGTCGPTGIPGSGNTPPVSPPQGNNGGGGGNAKSAGGGGGAGAVGAAGGCLGAPTQAGGGSGATTSISGSPTTYAGGGGGGSRGPTPVSPTFVGVTAGTGGSGGGGNGGASPSGNGTSGSANTGGGAGGAGTLDAHFGSAHSPGAFAGGNGGAGGKGIVIIRYKFQ